MKLRQFTAERVHSYFTALPDYKSFPERSFDMAKCNMISMLNDQINSVNNLTFEDFCNITGSDLNIK